MFAESKVKLYDRYNTAQCPDDSRDRLLSMYVNALYGYILVGSFVVIGRIIGLIHISLTEIISLAIPIALLKSIIIAFISKKRNFTLRSARLLFWAGLGMFVILYPCAIYFMRDMRFLGLIFAMIALTIELPHTTFAENLMITGTSIVMQIAVSFIAIHGGQQGNFYNELFYTICFIPIFTMIGVISRQINLQKMRIELGNRELSTSNEQLRIANTDLSREQQITANEIMLASHIQRSFFTSPPNKIKGWDIALCFRPLYGVSGDFYDFYMKDDELRGLSLFDVSGHGLSSALYTMLLKPVMFRVFRQMEGRSLGKVLGKLNESISAEFTVLDNFITGIVLRFNGGRIEYVNAGHPDLLLRIAATGQVRIIEQSTNDVKGEPIGISNNFPYKSLHFAMKKEDILLLFTDGLIESVQSNEHYGYERVSENLRTINSTSTAQEILDRILKDFPSYTQSSLSDDLTVIVVKRV
jgi:serine phosphatase RsbU (regulator of sigma subunit)